MHFYREHHCFRSWFKCSCGIQASRLTSFLNRSECSCPKKVKDLENRLASTLNKALLDLMESRLSVRLSPFSSKVLGSSTTSQASGFDDAYDIDLFDLRCSILNLTNGRPIAEPVMLLQQRASRVECGECLLAEKPEPPKGESYP